MKPVFDESRRQLLKKVALGAVLIPIAARTASAADLPLVADDDPTGKVLKYTPDASKATDDVRISPAAKIPGTDVRMLASVSMWPLLSSATRPRRKKRYRRGTDRRL